MEIDNALLADAAFGLFSASTLQRYSVVALQAAERAGISRALAFDERAGPEFVERCQQLMGQLRRGHERDAAEIELALILSALAASPSDRVERLLQDLGLAVEPPLGWPAALARHLRAERITSVTVRIAGVSATAEVGAVTSSSSEHQAVPRPRNPGRVEPIAA